MLTAKSKKGGAVPRNRAKRSKNIRQTVQDVPAVNVRISQCADIYMQAIADPFRDTCRNACIPDSITLPSAKYTFSSRGIFNCGTLGFGFVGVNPWSLVKIGGNTNATGTSFPVVSTTSLYATASAPAFVTAATANVSFAASTSVIPQVALQQGANFRLVGCGLRVRYIGPELTRAGRVVLFRPRDNTPYGVSYSISSVLEDIFYHTSPMTREWKAISYLPSRTEDISYGSYIDPTVIPPSGIPNTDYRILWAFIDGAQPSSALEFEVIAHFEVVGRLAGQTLQVTRSHSDPVGFGAIMSSLPSSFKENASRLYDYVKGGAQKALAYATSGVISYAGRAIGTALGTAIGGPVGGMIGGATLSSVPRLMSPEVTEID